MPEQDPAIFTIRAKGALLVFERDRTRETFLPHFAKSPNVFWMEHAIPEVIGAHFVQRQPRVLKRHAICVNGLAVVIQNHDCLWNKVNDSPQLLFVRKEFGLSELYVTSTGSSCQFLTCGTAGRGGVPLTTLLLHVNLSTVWQHSRPPCVVLRFYRRPKGSNRAS